MSGAVRGDTVPLQQFSPKDPQHYRQVLGRYPTGVVVVCSKVGGAPVGLTVGSFSSLSLDPPLISFSVAKTSSSWPLVRESGRFTVNVLSAEQEHLCRAMSRPGGRKFHGVEWTSDGRDLPRLHGAAAVVSCDLEAEYEGGDHTIVIGRVTSFASTETPAVPLLFFSGGYGSFVPASRFSDDRAADTVRVPELRRVMEDLATAFSTECRVIVPHGDGLLVAGSAGNGTRNRVPTFVGQTLAFRPPVGTVLAAHAGQECFDRWTEGLDEADRGFCEDLVGRVRNNGYSLSWGGHSQAGHEASPLDAFTFMPAEAQALSSEQALLTTMAEPDQNAHGPMRLNYVAAPVRDSAGSVRASLSVWAAETHTSRDLVEDMIDQLVSAVGHVTL